MSNISVLNRYFRAIESGDLEAMLGCYSASAVQHELPNRLKPAGDRRTKDDLGRDFLRGQTLLTTQTYEVLSVTEDGDRLAVEVLWRGQLAVAVGSLPEGGEMRTHSAIFFEFKDELIASQKNYDCFEVF